jgi:uncharacterized DUF497 family protein
MPRFKWDPEKNRTNLTKHGISFQKAQRIWANELSLLTESDEREDYGEIRYITTGHLPNLALVIVVHTEEDDLIRIISARYASPPESEEYFERIRYD